MHASTDARERQMQWEELITRKQGWGNSWVLCGDFNEIKCKEEKRGGIIRNENSFLMFRNFIATMEMGDLGFTGESFTWANNRKGEGFIQERLDRFFGSSDWLLHHANAEVKHFLRQSSDHVLLVLDTTPQRYKTKSRFIFDAK